MKDKLEIAPAVEASGPGENNPELARRHVPFAEAFRFWARLGFISFGGPAGQIAIMHRKLSNWPSILAGCFIAPWGA